MKKLKLPSPRPPVQLDNKILAYASDNTPEKRSYRPPLWASAMATVSVVAVAVFIVLPQNTEQKAPLTEAAISTEAAEQASRKAAVSIKAKQRGRADMSLATPVGAKRSIAPAAASSAGSATFLADKASAYDTASPVEAFDKSMLPVQLEKIFALFNKGKTSEAEAAYYTLKDLCPDCDLPRHLNQAMEKFNSNH